MTSCGASGFWIRQQELDVDAFGLDEEAALDVFNVVLPWF